MFEDQLYFADTTTMSVVKMNKFPKRGVNTSTVLRTGMELTGVKIEHNVLQRFKTRGNLAVWIYFYAKISLL